MNLKKSLSFFILIFFLSEMIIPPSLSWGKEEGKQIFRRLPYDLARDMKQSFWGVGGAVFVAGALTSALLSEKDNSLQTHFTGRPLFGKTGDDIFNVMGSPYTLAGISVVGWGVSWAIPDPKFKMTAESFLEAFFLTESMTLLAKEAFRRDRPNGESKGFPSGHASGAFSLASVLEVMYGPAVGLPSYAIASVIGLSRIDSNAHFVSDVLMGATIGGVIGWGTAEFHKNNYLPVEIAPSVSKNNYNLTVYYQF